MEHSAADILEATRSSLRFISIFLYEQTLPEEKSQFERFKSTEDMAKTLKFMIDSLLPEDMRWKE